MTGIIFGFVGLVFVSVAVACVRGRSIGEAILGPVLVFGGFIAYWLVKGAIG